jgi:hypothetical protein
MSDSEEWPTARMLYDLFRTCNDAQQWDELRENWKRGWLKVAVMLSNQAALNRSATPAAQRLIDAALDWEDATGCRTASRLTRTHEELASAARGYRESQKPRERYRVNETPDRTPSFEVNFPERGTVIARVYTRADAELIARALNQQEP